MNWKNCLSSTFNLDQRELFALLSLSSNFYFKCVGYWSLNDLQTKQHQFMSLDTRDTHLSKHVNYCSFVTEDVIYDAFEVNFTRKEHLSKSRNNLDNFLHILYYIYSRIEYLFGLLFSNIFLVLQNVCSTSKVDDITDDICIF